MPAPKTVLVPVDFEPASSDALAYARELTRPFRARLHILHVLEPSFGLAAGTEGLLGDFPHLESEAKAVAHRRLAALLENEDESGDLATAIVLGADPGLAIVRYAADIEADLIVMGTHGRAPGKPLGAIGSVADQVVRSAACPVVTVRHAPDGPRGRSLAPPAGRSLPSRTQ